MCGNRTVFFRKHLPLASSSQHIQYTVNYFSKWHNWTSYCFNWLFSSYSFFAAVVQVSLVRSYTILFQIITFIKSYYSREPMLLAVNFADSYEVNRSLLLKSPSKYSCSLSSSCNNSSCVISLLLSLRYSEYLEK